MRAYIAGAAHRPLPPARTTCSPRPGWPAGQPAFYRQIAQADQRHTDAIEPLYPAIDVPVLVVWGTEDTWIPVDRAHRLAELIPGAELQLVPDAGHLIQLDAPDALLRSCRGGCCRRDRAGAEVASAHARSVARIDGADKPTTSSTDAEAMGST